MAFKIVFGERFRDDFDDILNYLNKFSNQTAQKYRELINKRIRKLKQPPFGASYVHDDKLRKEGYRWLYIKNYILFFIVYEEDKIVSIERIMHSKRAYEFIL